jgi:hypothetical protein
MAKINKPIAFRVSVTEYERGWGYKPFDDIYFDNATEAK